MLRTVKVTSACLLLLLLSALALGQGGVATGDLRVTVKDPRASLVVNATVTVRDAAKGLERTATGDGLGGYGVRQLPPGTYSVTVEAPGFAKIENTGVDYYCGPVGGTPGGAVGCQREGSHHRRIAS